MSELSHTILAIVMGIIGLAIIAALLSPKSTTLGLVQNLSSGLAQDIGAADAPITGSSGNITFASSNTYA